MNPSAVIAPGDIVRSVLISMMLIVSMLMCCGFPASYAVAQSDDWPIGAEWVYSYLDTFDQAVFQGYLYYSCMGNDNWTIDQMTYPVIVYSSILKTNASGLLYGRQLSGWTTENRTEYYDTDNGELVAVVTDSAMKIMTSNWVEYNYLNYTEHNVTEYIPPGGTGFDPPYLDVGSVWFKNYTERSEMTSDSDGDHYEASAIFTEQVKFTFRGYEDVQVPAGTFHCSVVDVVHPDGTGTEMWSDDIDGYAKITQLSNSGESITMTLSSYKEPAQNAEIINGLGLTPLGIGFFIYVGVSLVAAIIAASFLRKRKRPPAVHDFTFGQIHPSPLMPSSEMK